MLSAELSPFHVEFYHTALLPAWLVDPAQEGQACN